MSVNFFACQKKKRIKNPPEYFGQKGHFFVGVSNLA